MSVKIIHQDTFKTIMSAVNKLVDFVSPTFGPSANKAIIDKQVYRMVVDDGVQIARDFELDDPAENAVIKVIREVAIKTNDRVGDGTTSSMIILRAIMQEISKQHFRDGRQISEELKKATIEAKDQLLAMMKPISTRQEIERVARIAYDNPSVASLIAELLHKVGKEGVVVVEKSNNIDISSEHTEGLEINSGYLSPYLITDNQRMEAVLDKPSILLTSYRVTNANDLLPIMDKIIKERNKRDFVLIADNVESDALATLIVNRLQGKFMGIAIAIPQTEDKKQFLEDIALLTGGTVFTEDKGNRLDNAEVSQLGQANKVIVRQNKTTIIGAKGSKTLIDAEKNRIRNALSENPKDSEKQKLEMRLARLNNGIAVIKVGSPTETESKALKYKIEDAVNATKSALNGGIVCGSGIALSQVKTSSEILNKALQQPFRQLRENIGVDNIELKPGEAYNAVTDEKGDYMKVVVIDPVEVLIAGIDSAVSIASMLVTTHGILCEIPDKK